MKNWATKQGIKVIPKKKDDFEHWASKFEGGIPSRKEFDLLNKEDRQKAIIHMSSNRAKKDTTNIHPGTPNVKRDIGAQDAYDAAIGATIDPKTVAPIEQVAEVGKGVAGTPKTIAPKNLFDTNIPTSSDLTKADKKRRNYNRIKREKKDND